MINPISHTAWKTIAMTLPTTHMDGHQELKNSVRLMATILTASTLYAMLM